MISLLMFNVDNERYLIGSILQDENVQREITALPDDLMHDDVNTKIFRTLKAMRREKKPIDIITVSNELQDSEYAVYIMRCARECPTTANYKQHIAHLLSLYERRTAYGLAQAFEQKLLSGDDLMACIGDLRSNLRHVKEPVSKLAHMSDVVTTTLDYIERKSKGEIVGMLTHIPDYDRFTGGLFKGNVTIIGARPAVGKSALGIEIAKNVAKHGGKVLVVSREMSDLQYGIRISSATSGINGMVLKNGTLGDNQWELLIDAMNELSTLPISFVFDIRNIEELNSFVVHEMDKDGVDLLVVDYLQTARHLTENGSAVSGGWSCQPWAQGYRDGMQDSGDRNGTGRALQRGSSFGNLPSNE